MSEGSLILEHISCRAYFYSVCVSFHIRRSWSKGRGQASYDSTVTLLYPTSLSVAVWSGFHEQ